MHSLQDTGTRENGSAGIGFGFGANGISSVSPNFGTGSGTMAWVNEQSGIFGTGDVNITVDGNTDMVGGVMASEDATVTLDTGTHFC